MENKCLVRNKKKQRSLFHQFTYTGKEVINLIKKNKLKELDVIYKLSVEPINSISMHYKFYILLQSNQLKIVELVIKDLKIDTFRSSGAGGQHINKTESAIRITHLPTGVVVECQDERSQYKNKDRALKILRSRLLAQAEQAQTEEIAADRRRQVGSGDRSGRIRTYNFPQNRVSDHRIELTLYRLDAVMNGDLDLLIEPLLAHEQAEKLQNRE